MSDRMIVAKDAWGEELPDWVETLVRECDQSSQNQVAGKLKVSGTVVSQTIRNVYPGSMTTVEQLVRDVFMNAPIHCPALKKEIPSATCLDYRRRAETWTHSNPFRVRMQRACRACPKFKKRADEN